MDWRKAMKQLGLLIAAPAMLVACGGSGGASDANDNPPPPAATAKSAVGKITGFGSIYVNGIEFDTNGATYEVDDEIGSDDSALSVGMVVKVQGSVSANGRTGQANSVWYDDDVEGIIEGLATDLDDASIKTFSVMGVSVRVDRNSTNFEAEDDPAFSFDTVINGDNVEVSGEHSKGMLIASFVEKQDDSDDDFEAKGTVTEYDNADNFVLLLRNGATLDVTIADGATIPTVGIENGQYVEVEGTIPDPIGAPDALLAIEIEIEDHDGLDDDDDDVEIKGMLTFDMGSETWSVRDVVIAFGDGTEYSPESLEDRIADGSADGLIVEVEGQHMNDVLQVYEIELEDDELEFKADAVVLSSTGPRDGTIRLSFGAASGTVDVVINGDTMFLDDDAMAHFDLDSITDMQKVEIEARWGDDGAIYASTLRIEDDTEYEITGPVDAIDDVSITVIDVTFSTDAETFFENGMPVVGDYVEVEDIDADGYADSVEIED